MSRYLIIVGTAALLTWAAATGDTPRSAPVRTTPPDDVQNLLYMGEKRPLRIRLHLRVSGQPLRERWQRFHEPAVQVRRRQRR
jgi:hypothetical protein